MNEENLVLAGGCRCGRVRFAISAPPLLTMACHCTGCQLMTSSAFSLSAAIPSEAFEITEGEPVIGGLHGSDRHYFCGWCMSWMFTRADGLDWFVNIRPTLLDERAWTTPFVETWTREKLPWARTAAVHSYETLPTFEDFARLTDEFAKSLKKGHQG